MSHTCVLVRNTGYITPQPSPAKPVVVDAPAPTMVTPDIEPEPWLN